MTPGLHTEEEFQTVVVLAQDMVNRRPLAYVSGDPHDELVLTPNTFLRPGDALPDHGEHLHVASDYVKRWKHVERSAQRVWERFLKEIIPEHMALQKWKGQQRALREGDVVFYLGAKKKGHWPVGRVLEVKPGTDGRPREAEVLLRGETQPKRLSLHRMGLLCPAEGE